MRVIPTRYFPHQAAALPQTDLRSLPCQDLDQGRATGGTDSTVPLKCKVLFLVGTGGFLESTSSS
jgi:hypothetical protein